MRELVERAVAALLEYCERENWSGYDPYDALNSRAMAFLGITRNKVLRLIATQVMKRSPVNLRGLLLVPKGENPKGCALACSSLLRLSSVGLLNDQRTVQARLQRLLELRSPGHEQYCWGYNFDWQSRGFLLPKFVPNIICTVFAGNALLDAYELYGQGALLEAASSAGEFLGTGLNITEDDDGVCFSYTPLDKGQVHNANLLGAAFLGRLFLYTGNSNLRELAEKAARFSLAKQAPDGSWPYGEAASQRWIDNFHTGYNLVALKRLYSALSDRLIGEAISKGLSYYVTHFFADGGIPKYFHDRLWPIDIHSAAQSIVTLCELGALHAAARPMAEKVCAWTLANMWSDRGFFYFQKTRLYDNRISYMRWSQIWMLYALATFLTLQTN